MGAKVSVIIPCYNAEKYIEACLNSVLQQTYHDIEAVVVDDGSTDQSWEILKTYSRKCDNLKIFRQVNMNASIARNHGIEKATGDYFLFLDADDLLFPDAVSLLVKNIEISGSDLAVGNFCEINESGQRIRDCIQVSENGISVSPILHAGEVPNPSNKLYSRRIIEDNDIRFGNVRIGQDLNFYLKYLSCCTNMVRIREFINQWRIVSGSITNSYSFRIFDITESFKDTRKFYEKSGKLNLYNEYILPLEYRHYYLQMEKQKYFSDVKARKIVVNYFSYFLKKMDVRNCSGYENIRADVQKCRLKIKFKRLYMSKLYLTAYNILSRE